MRYLEILSQFERAIQKSSSPEELYFVFLTTFTSDKGLGYNRAFYLEYQEEKDALVGIFGIGFKNLEKTNRAWESIKREKTHSLSEVFSKFKNFTKEDDLYSLVMGQTFFLKEDSIWKKVLTDRKVCYFEKIPEEYSNDPILSQLESYNFAVIPIINDGNIYGIIYVDNHFTGKKITEDDLKVLELFASAIGFQLDIFNLQKKLKEKIEKLRELNKKLIEAQNRISLLNSYYSFALFSKQVLEQIAVPVKNVFFELSNHLLNVKECPHKDVIEKCLKELGKVEEIFASIEENIEIFWQSGEESKTDLSFKVLDVIEMCQEHLKNNNVIVDCGDINFYPVCKINEKHFEHILLSLITQIINYHKPQKKHKNIKFKFNADGDYAIINIETDELLEKAINSAKNYEIKSQRDFFEDNMKVTLNLCKNIVNLHKGDIEIIPSESNSLTIKIKIPLHKEQKSI